MITMVITIINSSSVNPAVRDRETRGRGDAVTRRRGGIEKRRRGDALVGSSDFLKVLTMAPVFASPFLRVSASRLPVAILLAIERCFPGLRTNIENVFPAPRTGISCVVAGTEIPVCFSSHRIDRDRAQVDFLLCRKLRIANFGSIHPRITASTHIPAPRYDVHT